MPATGIAVIDGIEIVKTVIVPLDGSELSQHAIHLAATLAAARRGSITLIHVVDEPAFSDLPPAMTAEDRANATQYLASVGAAIDGRVPVETRILSGDPTEELLRYADRTPEAMIAMSTHGRGGVGRVMFGSVADKVVRGSKVPVALVRDEHDTSQKQLRTILVPLDGSPLSETALPYAVELAEGTGATLALVRVIDPIWQSAFVVEVPESAFLSQDQVDEIEEQAHADARADLDTLATQLRAKGLRVVWEVRTGRPDDEIARVVETTGADLILMSTHGRGGIRRWAFGSITNELLHRGNTPILAIPPGAHAREITEPKRSTITS